MKLSDLLNMNMEEALEWLESDSQNFELIEKPKGEHHQAIKDFLNSWDAETAKKYPIDFIDSLFDVINENQVTPE